MAPLWLAHHRGAGLARCWNLGGLRICARCSGLLPALLIAMLWEWRWPLTIPSRWALAAEVALIVPGLWDALRGAVSASGGSNWLRGSSGAGLGLALGHAAMVGQNRGWLTPEALLPMLAAIAATLWFLDQDRLQRRAASAASS
jgi:uncharacterized membrane protein